MRAKNFPAKNHLVKNFPSEEISYYPAKNLPPPGNFFSNEESFGEESSGEEFSGEECSTNQQNRIILNFEI
jgi:hypothetical protein